MMGLNNYHVLTLVVEGNDALIDANHIGRHAYTAISESGRRVQQILRCAEIVCRG